MAGHPAPCDRGAPSLRAAKAIAQVIQHRGPLIGDGEAIFCEACRLGLEGLVSKRLGSGYVSGRARNWLKTKNPAFERS
jgi:bifunctional non-homologous end joining protein LigD